MEVTALPMNLQWENKLQEEAKGSGSEAEDHGLLLWEETGFISSSLSHGQWLAYVLDQQGK